MATQTRLRTQTRKRASTAGRTTKGRKVASAAKTALATCPVNGAGWCPYPFSPAQLEKRLKQKAQQGQ